MYYFAFQGTVNLLIYKHVLLYLSFYNLYKFVTYVSVLVIVYILRDCSFT